MNPSKKGSIIALVIVVLIYGTTYLVVKDSLSALTPGLLLVCRSSLAVLTLLPFSIRHFKTQSKSFYKLVLLSGLSITAGYLFQTIGSSMVSPGKTAFLENSYCIVVPLLTWFLSKKHPTKEQILSIGLALVGIFFISIYDLDGTFGLGEFYCTIAGVFYAINIVLTGLYLKEGNPLVYTTCQMGVLAILTITYTFLFEHPTLTFSGDMIARLIYLGPIATGLAWVLRNKAQAALHPNTISIVLPLSSVFATFVSALLGWENLTWSFLIGAFLLLAAILLPPFLNLKKEKREQ